MTATGPRPGRDRQAERHPAAPGATTDGGRHHVAVLGGGIAGLAAATALAERDVRVTLLEAQHELGGRVRAWPVEAGGSRATMSRGFHAFFRQYYNLRALLRRADPELARLTPLADYPLVSAEGHRDSFAGLPLTPPLNLMDFVRRTATFTLRDLARVDVRAALEMLDVEFPRSFTDHDGESAADYLRRLRFPDAARHLALEVFARSFFADPGDFAAGELLAMFHAYFLGSAEGLVFDVPDDDYDTALWAPLGSCLAGLGVDMRVGVGAEQVRSEADSVLVETSGAPVRADAVVVATDLATVQDLLGDPAAARTPEAWRQRLGVLGMAPPFAVHRIWTDRIARPDRAAFLGTAGFGVVDNVSLLDRFEAGARDWTRAHGGSVVELHAYALDATTRDDAVRAEMRETLDRVYPEFRGATVVAEQYLRRADCPLVGTQPWAQRPGVVTPDPRVVLAGDGVRCAYPVALMERAATTGFQAANALLAGWQVAGHDLWTVPTAARGWFRRPVAGLRRAAPRQPRAAVRTV